MVAKRRLRVAVFTTSYPRHQDDFAGRFVSDAVAHLRRVGIAVDVVAPGVYSDYGLAFDGGGIMRNIRRRPWLAPLLFLSMVRSLRRARVVLCVSEALAESVRRTGVENVVFVPNGIAVPECAGEEAEPLEVFFTGRLSPEKGVRELAAATEGMNLVVTGDGPLRDLVPTRGFVSREELADCFARAAVVVCPSLSEGFGVVCGEAMAHGKPVVASAVGGLANLIEDGRTGILAPPGDVAALRAAIERVLADRDLRRRLGAAARERIESCYGWERVTGATLAAYLTAVERPTTPADRAPRLATA